ncbi:neuropeptide Y receptor type 4-like [Tachypleus tridentatus]|uniref:neuropeptide Y receptor type 4-like n=1 Tax=Tachypleus tridentatus TaxID=6853 RepID=UPI003FD3C3A6
MKNIEMSSSNQTCHHCFRACHSPLGATVLKMNIIMVVTFIALWTPYALTSVWSIFDSNLPAILYILPTMCAKSSCMMNPIIYGFTNHTLRGAMQEIWLSVCCRDRTTNRYHYRLEKIHQDVDKEGVFTGPRDNRKCECHECHSPHLLLHSLSGNSPYLTLSTRPDVSCAQVQKQEDVQAFTVTAEVNM